MNLHIRYIVVLIVLGFFIDSCQTPSTTTSHEKMNSALFAVEKEFCAMAQSEGVEKAFVYFADDSAVIFRGNLLLKGKEAIRLKYSKFQSNAKLEWVPDFADVSASGDLGYTYGKYTLTTVDSIGHTTQSSGIFHTVWKRQPDGQWRFVWD